MPTQIPSGDLEIAGQKRKQPPAVEASDIYRTGIGGGLTGGEIVAQRSHAGAPTFTNEAASPGITARASAMPAGGIGGGLNSPGVSNLPDDMPLAQRGSLGNVGNGIGTFSQMQPGDSQLAIERFGRANEIRARTLQDQSRGGRLTIIPDSSRTPTLADRQRARLDERQANTELTKQRTQQSILAGLDERMTGQLERQRLQQEIQAGGLAIDREQALGGILAGLNDPNLQGEARAQSEREYLMRADPKAFLERQAKSGIDQVDLEKKQLERDLLRLELNQGGIGGGLKLTEQQSKDLGYYTRGNEANAQLARQGDALTSRATGERGQVRGLADTLVRGTPWIGDSALANSLVSTERQQAEQAGREVLAAILRKDTGAAITQQEMEIYGRMYLPQPGDSDEVLNQKAEARTRALASIRGGLGTAERKAAPLLDGQRTSNAAPTRISGDDDYSALPSGALFVAPDGTTRRKP